MVDNYTHIHATMNLNDVLFANVVKLIVLNGLKCLQLTFPVVLSNILLNIRNIYGEPSD